MAASSCAVSYTLPDAASMADKVEWWQRLRRKPAKKVIYPVAVVKYTAHPGRAKELCGIP